MNSMMNMGSRLNTSALVRECVMVTYKYVHEMESRLNISALDRELVKVIFIYREIFAEHGLKIEHQCFS